MDSHRTLTPDSIGELVEGHYEDLYRFAYRLSGCHADAEDLTQQAFLIACKKLHQVQDPARVRGWMLTIVRNVYLKSRQRVARQYACFDMIAVEHCEADFTEFNFDEEALQHALEEIPEPYRISILLYYFEEIGYKEIAELLGIPIGTVMSRLSRARKFLRERLSSEARTPVSIEKFDE